MTKAYKPKILFLGLHYPDVQHDSSLYTELIDELASAGADIRVVAPVVDPGRVGLCEEGKVTVLRVPAGPLLNTGLFQKALSNLALPFRYYGYLRRYLTPWRPDWVVTPTPPITLTPLVWWFKRHTKSKSYLILRDIFPQNAVDLGLISRFGPAHAFFRLLEKWTYKTADRIGCMSPANIRYVLDHNPVALPDKLHILPNWISERYIHSSMDRRSARCRWGVGEDDLLCVFGGNLGKPQNPGFLIDVAEAVKDDSRIKIVIVGKGTESAIIGQVINSRGLKNISLRDRLPKSQYQQLLAAADIGLILLSDRFSIPNIPSRLMGYWAAAVPVMAATDKNTDLDDAFLHRYGGGTSVQMGDIEGFADKLRWFAEHPREAEEMGLRGQRAIRERFTSKHAAAIVLDQLS